MTQRRKNSHCCPINNPNGGVVGILIVLILLLALVGGGGFFAYTKFLKKEPLQTKLVSQKVKEEVLQFTNDYVSQAIYQNLITMDDTVVMLDKEIKRLKRIGTKFPNQRTIITTQTDQLSTTRNRLAKAMGEVTAALERIYVIWLVEHKKGIDQIKAQKRALNQQLTDTIRDEAELISRIRSNPPPAS